MLSLLVWVLLARLFITSLGSGLAPVDLGLIMVSSHLVAVICGYTCLTTKSEKVQVVLKGMLMCEKATHTHSRRCQDTLRLGSICEELDRYPVCELKSPSLSQGG